MDEISFGQRLKQLREAKKLTQRKLAKLLNIGSSTIAMYELDKREPDFETASKIADFFGVSVDYLLGRSDSPQSIDDIFKLIPGAYPAGNMVKLPVLGVIRAGEPILAVENVIGWEEVPKNQVRDGEYFFLRVTGDSMKDANIPHGCFVLVKKQDRIEDNQIAVVLVNGEEATIKRVKKLDSQILLLPANPAYEPQVYNANEVKIIGRVVKAHISFE